MSSTGPSATIASISSTSSSPADASGNPGTPVDLTGNSSLPFSFLITFIAIFLFFLGCGLGSRRVTRQLRRNLGLQITPVSAPPSRQENEKPILWDVYPSHPPLPTKSEDAENGSAYGYAWENLSVSPPNACAKIVLIASGLSLQPLSATYVRTTVRAEANDIAGNPAPEPPPRFRWGAPSFIPSRGMMRTLAASPGLARPLPPFQPRQAAPRRIARPQPEVHWRGHRLPQFIARPLLPPGMHPRPSDRETEADAREAQGPVSALQLSVVIAMPAPENSQARAAREKLGGSVTCAGKSKDSVEIEEYEVSPVEDLGDYMLGFARVPWALEEDEQQAFAGKGKAL